MKSGPDYSGKLRVRACGLLMQERKLLLVQLKSPVTDSLIWVPPGGGVEFGESLQDAVRREFLEETGLVVEVGALKFVNELIREPFHAIEFYFLLKETGGSLQLGKDPEYHQKKQILKKLQFFSQEELVTENVSPLFLKDEFWEADSSVRFTGSEEE